MSAPVVILACGNPSRGDDALGPVLLDRLHAWLDVSGQGGDFELIEDFQFQVEHALDLQGRRLALFVDAGTGTPAPFSFSRLEASDVPGHSTHAISPAAVLSVYGRVVGDEAPPAYVLCVRGERFELGEAMSPAATAHAEAALTLLQRLCTVPDMAAWDAQAYNPNN